MSVLSGCNDSTANYGLEDFHLAFQNSSFHNNNATTGGSLALPIRSIADSFLHIENCLFWFNSASLSGGAMALLSPENNATDLTIFQFANSRILFSLI